MTKITDWILGLAAGTLIAVSAPALAATTLVTSDLGYAGPVLDLGAFENGSYNFTFGPESLPGGITFTANPGGGGETGLGSVIGQGGYGLAANGSFGGAAVYIGVDSGTGYAELTFAKLVSSFGGYWNYAPGTGNNPVIEAFDAVGALLGSFDLSILAPISTPNAINAFAFRGIESDKADIKTIRFGGSFILLAGTPDGSVVAPIPVPAALPLLLGALALLGAAKRLRKPTNV